MGELDLVKHWDREWKDAGVRFSFPLSLPLLLL